MFPEEIPVDAGPWMRCLCAFSSVPVQTMTLYSKPMSLLFTYTHTHTDARQATGERSHYVCPVIADMCHCARFSLSLPCESTD